MPLQIVPITSATPQVIQATEAKTYDTWFLKDFHLYSTTDRTFNAKVLWTLGKLNDDGTSELSNRTGFCYIENLLSETALTDNPEIAAVLTPFLSALEAISKRKNAIN